MSFGLHQTTSSYTQQFKDLRGASTLTSSCLISFIIKLHHASTERTSQTQFYLMHHQDQSICNKVRTIIASTNLSDRSQTFTWAHASSILIIPFQQLTCHVTRSEETPSQRILVRITKMAQTSSSIMTIQRGPWGKIC